VFEASAGPDVNGQRSEGRQAVRAAFATVFETFQDAHWANARHVVAGDRGVSEWTFTGTNSDGTRVEVNGCDLFTFRDGKIAIKNSYRKNRPAIRPEGTDQRLASSGRVATTEAGDTPNAPVPP
jgi:ketosteroid isomerase-like protein